MDWLESGAVHFLILNLLGRQACLMNNSISSNENGQLS